MSRDTSSTTTNYPTEIKRIANTAVSITWSDGQTNILPAATLRSGCPSAASKAARGDESHDKPLTGRSALRVVSAEIGEQLGIEEIWSVGNYAIGMRWSDGHDSGIYSFDYLRELAKSVTGNTETHKEN